MYNIKKVIEICNDVISKASTYLNELEFNYLIIEDSCVSNAKDKFLLPFYSIKAVLSNQKCLADEILAHLITDQTYCDVDYVIKRKSITDNYFMLYNEKSEDKRWMTFDRNKKIVYKRIYTGDKILDSAMSIAIEGTNKILEELDMISDTDILSWVNSAIKSKEIACDQNNMDELKYIRMVFEQRIRE